MGTYIQLDEKEIKLLRDYVDDMIKLFGERDMIQEGEALYLSTEEIYVTRQDFEILRKKMKWNYHFQNLQNNLKLKLYNLE